MAGEGHGNFSGKNRGASWQMDGFLVQCYSVWRICQEEVERMKGTYRWWGKGDIEASLGVFFDGFSKILSGTGILLFVFGLPAEIVLGKVVPGIGLAIFAGNLWYFYEAWALAKKEGRQDVTAQPFGIGSSQLTGWLYLIMGPVYWQTGDGELAFQIGLAASLLGGVVEILGGYMGRWIVRVVPHSALMGNMASSALVWLSFVGIAMVFDKPVYALLPFCLVVIDYLGKADKRFRKIPTGVVAIVLGSAIAWATGYLTPQNFVSAFSGLGFYPPTFCGGDILRGISGIVPFLPVIIPLQINNFLSTLQGIESAKAAGDCYPERRCMVMDGVSTMLGALFGNPFPTTVYFGHPGWKELGARAGFTVVNGVAYLAICLTGLTGVLMALIPTEVVMVLLIFVGFSVTASTFQTLDRGHVTVVLLSLVPILFQYIQTLISSAVQAAGTTVEAITAAQFGEFSVPIQGIQCLGNGAFLSSLLLAGLLACVLEKRYFSAAGFGGALAFCSFIGMIHAPEVALFPLESLPFGLVYLAVAALLVGKGMFSCEGGRKLSGGL